jgi:citrate synthase
MPSIVGARRRSINVDRINVDASTWTGHDRRMTRYVGAGEAARLLGVQRATLYAYVSRGLIDRRVAVDGRTSLYAVDDVESLAGRVRKRETAPRPSLDVQIATAITVLDEAGVTYFGHDVATLARSCTFEQVAELLWTGELPPGAAWPAPAAADVQLAADISAIIGEHDIGTLVAVAGGLGARHATDDPPTAARRLLGVVPVVLRARPARDIPAAGPLAGRLAAAWHPAPTPELARVVDRALVLLADHELATSTLAVRVAGSTWPGPYLAFAAGLATIGGIYHGGAAAQAHDLLVECERAGGAAEVVVRRLQAREKLPGFGHKIYVGDDPRLAPLLEIVATLPDPGGRMDVVDDVLAETGVRMTKRPNVDLGLAALSFVAGLPGDVPLFSVARIAGFAAHLQEEMGERPVRFRGIARPRD